MILIGRPFENWNAYLDYDGPPSVLSDSQTPPENIGEGGLWFKASKDILTLLWSDAAGHAPIECEEDPEQDGSAKCAVFLKTAWLPLHWPDRFLAQMFVSLPFISSFSGRDILHDFLLCPILLPIHLYSFQFWLDIINGHKSFPAYKINNEMVSGWQKEEVLPHNLLCKQSATAITGSFHMQIRRLTWCMILIGPL